MEPERGRSEPEGRAETGQCLGDSRLRGGPAAAPRAGTRVEAPSRSPRALAPAFRIRRGVRSDARLGHEPVCGGGGGGGHRAGRRHGEIRAAAAHGAPPGVLLPAACAQSLRAADADGRREASPGEGVGPREETEPGEGRGSDGGGRCRGGKWDGERRQIQGRGVDLTGEAEPGERGEGCGSERGGRSR